MIDKAVYQRISHAFQYLSMIEKVPIIPPNTLLYLAVIQSSCFRVYTQDRNVSLDFTIIAQSVTRPQKRSLSTHACLVKGFLGSILTPTQLLGSSYSNRTRQFKGPNRTSKFYNMFYPRNPYYPVGITHVNWN